MSWRPAPDPITDDAPAAEIDGVVEPRPRDLGGFTVQRILPAIGRRQVGPFVFLDDADVERASGQGIDVRPHPHIGLSTVSYLFHGEVVHRDSLGSHQSIRPGDINWMTAGRGIVHSERSGPDERARAGRVHLVQLWVGLPVEHEETEPRFFHHPARSLPGGDDGGVAMRVLIGHAYGIVSPVETFSPMFYVDVTLQRGADLALPADHEERAALVIDGAVSSGGRTFNRAHLIVFHRGAHARLHSDAGARVLLLGGAPIGPRHVYWNFVSSSRDRIEAAKSDWRAGRFPLVPGDEHERIPLPDES